MRSPKRPVGRLEKNARCGSEPKAGRLPLLWANVQRHPTPHTLPNSALTQVLPRCSITAIHSFRHRERTQVQHRAGRASIVSTELGFSRSASQSFADIRSCDAASSRQGPENRKEDGIREPDTNHDAISAIFALMPAAERGLADFAESYARMAQQARGKCRKTGLALLILAARSLAGFFPARHQANSLSTLSISRSIANGLRM